jgi:ABC-type transporter Mla subunit MlaD
LGIIEQKNVTLQLPSGLKEAMDKVQGAVDKASGKINAAIDQASPLVAETTSTVVSTMDDVLKTTRDVTGMGVAAAGTIDLQLAMVNDFMMDATTDIATGLASIEAGVKSTIKDVNNFKNNANTVVSKFNDEVKRIKDWRYPISITVISWEKVADLFTNPVDHFKALYPIESMADVESLMTRIMDILHNINSDIPDFSSLSKLLEDLLRKLQKHVIKKINELKAQMKEVASEVKKKIQKH